MTDVRGAEKDRNAQVKKMGESDETAIQLREKGELGQKGGDCDIKQTEVKIETKRGSEMEMNVKDR